MAKFVALISALGLTAATAGSVWGQQDQDPETSSAPDSQPVMITAPEWTQKPSGYDLAKLYPSTASRVGKTGRVTIECVVSDNGLLRNCKIVEEVPEGYGFGAAALAISNRFRMSPMARNGVPTDGARVQIPISFGCSDCTPAPASEREAKAAAEREASRRSYANTMLANVTWIGGPSFQQWSAAYPERAIEQGLSGNATVHCRFASDGHLKTCKTVAESPRGHGFGRAAVSLSKYFVGPSELRGVSTEGAGVEYNVSFPISLPRGGMAPLTDARFWRLPTANAINQAFPQKAKQAGVAYGEATLLCQRPDQPGPMTCKIDSEMPEGLGFGDAAMSLEPNMAVNAWAADGRPTTTNVLIPIALGTPGPGQQSESILAASISGYASSGDLDKAYVLGKEYIERFPRSPDIDDVIEPVYLAFLESDHPERGFEIAEAAAQLRPNPVLLRELCWNQAIRNVRLGQALKDCQAALAMASNYGEALDSLGLVQLRLANYQAAIAAYDRRLADEPDAASSLMGRGLARQAQGDIDGAKADISHAQDLDHDVADQFRKYGFDL